MMVADVGSQEGEHGLGEHTDCDWIETGRRLS